MSNEDTAATGQATAPQTAQANASSVSKTKTKKGRRSAITEEFWAELRELYESGNYSQRDLVTYARTRGIQLTQPRIARKAGEQGWLKGVRIEEIREKVREEIKEGIATEYRRMLETHAQQARLLQGEAMQHIRAAHEMRKVDPDYRIPPQSLSVITSTLDRANVMEARAIGFDYKEGRPFKSPEEEVDQGIESMRVDVMSPAEEARIRDQAEREALGFSDVDDVVPVPGEEGA